MPHSDATGILIHYHDSGGSGAPLLVLHGFGDTGSYLPRAWLDAVARTFRVLRVDNRGTGGSGLPTATFSIEDMAADAVGVLDSARVERAHVFGHSMGGMIAQAIALASPDRVDRLVLEATAPSATHPLRDTGEAVDPERVRAFARLATPDGSAAPAVAADADEIRAFFSVSSQVAPGFFDGPRGEAALAEMVDIRREVPGPPKDVLALQGQAVRAFDVWDRLGEIRADTLVVHPELDLKPLAHAEAITAAIPSAKLCVIPGSGHMVRWEAPDDEAAIVISFLTAGATEAEPERRRTQ